MAERSKKKPISYDGNTTLAVFKAQLNAVAYSNGWADKEKATELIVTLREQAAVITSSIPIEKRRE